MAERQQQQPTKYSGENHKAIQTTPAKWVRFTVQMHFSRSHFVPSLLNAPFFLARTATLLMHGHLLSHLKVHLRILVNKKNKYRIDIIFVVFFVFNLFIWLSVVNSAINYPLRFSYSFVPSQIYVICNMRRHMFFFLLLIIKTGLNIKCLLKGRHTIQIRLKCTTGKALIWFGEYFVLKFNSIFCVRFKNNVHLFFTPFFRNRIVIAGQICYTVNPHKQMALQFALIRETNPFSYYVVDFLFAALSYVCPENLVNEKNLFIFCTCTLLMRCQINEHNNIDAANRLPWIRAKNTHH